MATVQTKLDAARTALAGGRCTVAYMNILEMWEARGASDAHGRETVAHDFTTRCLRDTATPGRLGGVRSRRRSRR